MMLRMLVLARKGTACDRLRAELDATGLGQRRIPYFCYEDEASAYDACRAQLPDVVICQEYSPVLLRIAEELQVPVLVVDADAPFPLFCTTRSAEDYRARRRQGLILLLDVDESEWIDPRDEVRTLWHAWAYVFWRMGFPVPDFIAKTKPWRGYLRLMEGW